MDINSLLSPSDSPAQTPPPQPSHASPSLLGARSPNKRPGRQQMPSRTPSGLSQQITSSPQVHLAHQKIPSPGYGHLTNGARAIHSATSTPQPLGSPHDAVMTPPSHMYRQASTPGMDALADLASMQHQQQAVRQSSLPHQRPVTLQHLGQHLSGDSVTSAAMSEHSPRPRSFATRSLDQQHIDYLEQLDRDLSENPFNYYSHLALVTTLHQGFQKHLESIEASPHDYELIHILRDAYRVMSDKYPLGETLWHYRLNDEKMLAGNSEERMGVLELHKQATHDEPYSAKLWAAYGEYVSYLVACSWEQVPPEEWSEEDKLIGRELFQPQLLVEALQQGAERVKYNLQESNLVWDRYLQVLEEDLERTGLSQEKVTTIASIYNERLGQPHATWSHTRSRYISFIQRYNLGDPEQVNEQVTQKNSHIIQQCANREDYEFKVLQAIQQGDQAAEYHAVTRYLKWEKKTMGVYSFPLVNALYERATLRFPVDPSLWEDHVEFLIWQNDRSVDLLNVLERATRHCPWSGSLWSHRILTLEVENKAFAEIEHVKHTATGTGLLEHSDIEEIIKVQIAWCGYLRRRAFEDPKATDDDADIAEVGIRSALEFVREVGMKKHGRDWAGDPQYRLERIHMKYWLQRGNVDEARNIWESLVKHQADTYDFWYRWYIFEMVFWSQHAIRNGQNAGQQLLTPTRATAVLARAMERLQTIDHPEPIMDMYMNHCEQHENVLQVRSAAIEKRRAERRIAMRRQKEQEAAEAAAAAAVSQPQADLFAEGSTKRKRDDASVGDDAAAKKSKQAISEDVSPAAVPVDGEQVRDSEAPSETQISGAKRDREHTSVIVKKLPADTTQTQIRQFFTDAGTVRNLVLKPEQDSLTAVVEFETSEEADYALSKEAKGYKGQNISIERGDSTTLYVTNYPAHADEAYLRKYFEPFGEIIGYRFPSLKFDTHRRFCYVQFANAAQAVAATQLDGTDVEGLKLNVKVSNPQAKKKRDGATAEGREVYVWHLNFKIKKHEVHEAFAQFGHIDRINFPMLKNGNNKGFCFVVYDTKESADSAVAEMDNKNFWGLELHVEIANDKNETKPKIKSTLQNAASSAPRGATPGATQDVPVDTAGAAASAAPVTGTKAAPFSERSLAILNLPDTVPDVRIKPLVEPYGFKKITLEPQHGGAVVEFTSVEGTGKAEIALQGLDFEGRKLRIGTVKDLRQQKGEWKAGNSFVQPNRVQRPTARGGGRARGRTGFGARPAVPRAAASTNGEAAKSNNDFRNMILNKAPKEAESSNDKMEE
ncbi:Splicing factor [Curvularia kusanoi]|uniref:U4/U6 snRNA-associated-splicing factor PRP24 n=1 Tax=Curvularia kusanoi TaxID=90978 RepID=A0A9P4WEC5_CURKU|nr:Splicing factor [Curvularia kusanoi]